MECRLPPTVFNCVSGLFKLTTQFSCRTKKVFMEHKIQKQNFAFGEIREKVIVHSRKVFFLSDVSFDFKYLPSFYLILTQIPYFCSIFFIYFKFFSFLRNFQQFEVTNFKNVVFYSFFFLCFFNF